MIKHLAPVLVLVAVLGGPAGTASALTGDSVDLFYGPSHTLPVLNVRSAEGGGCTALAEPFHTGSAWNHSTVYTAHLYSGAACDGVVHAVLAPGEDTSFASEFEVGSILFATDSPVPADPPATGTPRPGVPSSRP